MRWGFMPAWVKDPRSFTLVINARSESVREKPAFKNAIRRRRVLVPADGYYEWQVIDGRKRPLFIHRADRAPLGFAALAETWMGPNGEEVDTVALMTAAASADLATLHHRVPVTIRPDDFSLWLDCRAHDADDVMHLMVAPREGEFTWYEVSTRVNAVANDDEQLLLPMTEEMRAVEDAQRKPAKKVVSRKMTTNSADDGQGSLF
ncbi:conserved protein of unknown function [Bradyrhizobium sp. ORS 285]|nr:conserved hypothetical protein [Bradyrhizobium sp. ORS 285]SMX60045.1 conserved protein of unknown function [Bradyrhizobium sp. ORS 285]